MTSHFKSCQVALLDAAWPNELLQHPDGAEAWAVNIHEEGGISSAGYGKASQGSESLFAEVRISALCPKVRLFPFPCIHFHFTESVYIYF